MKEHCIIFILKNDEFFLTENINKIIELRNKFDIYFITREYNERVNLILKTNKFINIELTYDLDYYESLRAGFEFIKNIRYRSCIEFGEINSISLDEIEKLHDINKESNFEKSVIFVSRYKKNHRVRRRKFYIFLSIRKKISDPYSKLKIYNRQTFDCIRNEFDNTMYPHNFLNLIYKFPNFIEVRTKVIKNQKVKIFKKLKTSFSLFVYTIFILPFTKNVNKNKYK